MNIFLKFDDEDLEKKYIKKEIIRKLILFKILFFIFIIFFLYNLINQFKVEVLDYRIGLYIFMLAISILGNISLFIFP
jgi:hypothetical protein